MPEQCLDSILACDWDSLFASVRILLDSSEPMPSHRNAAPKIPNLIRWASFLWLIFWVSTYWRAWGLANFLHLCDATVVLSCIGLWTSNALLLSSQAVSSLMIDSAWTLDVSWRFFLGRHLIGGIAYFFDPRFPLWVRMLSLFHIVTPPLLLWAVHRTGYDPRGWKLQSLIALALFAAARFTNPQTNINFAFRDPFFHRSWGPAPVHIGLTLLVLICAVYLPTHLFLRKCFPPAPEAVK